MTTTKKVVIGVAAAAVIYMATRKKKTTAATPAAAEDKPEILVDKYEGKTIQNTGARNWSLVLNGKRYGYISGPAFSNYVAKNPIAGPQNEIGDDAYNSYPEGGYIDETGTIIYYNAKLGYTYGLGVDRGFCTMKNPDGTNTIYGESMISGNPCPRGGTLIPQKVTFV